MKIKYQGAEKNMGIPMTDSYGNQIATGILQDGTDIVVMFVDTIIKTLYIERVINKNKADMLESGNLTPIRNTAQWNAYGKFFDENGCVPEGCRV
jgi:hypothetical protein